MRRQTNRRRITTAIKETQSVIRAVGYVRCSDEGQSTSEFNTLDNQKNFISQHVSYTSSTSEIPWDLTRFYVDDGVSGKNTDRPALAELLADVRAGKVDAIVVYKLDRITRSISDYFQLDRLFSDHGVTLVSVKEKLDTSSPMGRAMRSILLVFAELERETIAERTRDKMYAEVKQGRCVGGVAPFGYHVEDRRLVPDPKEALVIQTIFRKFAETRSVARTRDYLNLTGYRTAVRPWKGATRGGGKWSGQSVDKILRNPVYIGTRMYGDIEVPDNHPAIVSPELFELVNTAMPSRSRIGRNDINHVYLLQGLVRCPHCGGRMTSHYVRHRDNHTRPRDYTPYYQCQRPRKYGATEKCPVQRYNADRLEAAVLAALRRLVVDPSALAEALQHIQDVETPNASDDRIEEIRRALADLEPRIEHLLEAVEQGSGIASVRERLSRLDAQKKELRAELMVMEAEKRQEPKGIVDVNDSQSLLGKISEWLEEGSADEKREVLASLVMKVEAVDKKTVQVTFAVPTAPLTEKPSGSKLHQLWLPR